jgi:hypothetical protein
MWLRYIELYGRKTTHERGILNINILTGAIPIRRVNQSGEDPIESREEKKLLFSCDLGSLFMDFRR